MNLIRKRSNINEDIQQEDVLTLQEAFNIISEIFTIGIIIIYKTELVSFKTSGNWTDYNNIDLTHPTICLGELVVNSKQIKLVQYFGNGFRIILSDESTIDIEPDY